MINGNDSSLTSAEVANAHGGDVESSKGTVWDLIVPILTLIVVTVLTIVYTGYVGAMNNASDFNLFFVILDNINLSTALRFGGAAGLIVSMAMAYRHVISGEVTQDQYSKPSSQG